MSLLRKELRKRLALHVLTDREWSRGRDMLTIAAAAIDGGATVIQLRDKTASTRFLVEEGLALRKLTRDRDVLLIINDRIDVALAIDADGAHVGQDDMPAQIARQLLGPERILGVSAGNLAEAKPALAAGADYLGVGPIYPTLAKSDAGPATGYLLLSELAQSTETPLVAIGGVTAENAGAIMAAGASGIAVIRAVVHAEDVTGATRALYEAIKRE